ncbi:transketolase-like TK C-terminal-containing protein [Staphylococcus xylosus]|uniref:transketolase-like TK C-terminal-containing protein n=1 Tax=Staphylococcus xylosus TaxID=1288 RepID=UPI001F54229F|nr:transketolase C-terminal domain-containing protein [Staphylococcus xylosus]
MQQNPHDSIALGEDGKTHQPIEHLASLRAMPNFSLIRPADGNEVNAAWQLAMEADTHPTGIVLSRQSLPIIKNTKEKAYNGVKKGAYIISEEETKDFNAIIIATGSEVHLAIEAQKRLKEDEIDVRVVSFPSWDKFEKQPQSYKDFILPPSIKNRLSVEMGSSQGWREYVGEKGKIISIDTFGSSAPANVLIEKYGFIVENIIKHVKNFNLKIK